MQCWSWSWLIVDLFSPGFCKTAKRRYSAKDCPEIHILCCSVQGGHSVSGSWHFVVIFYNKILDIDKCYPILQIVMRNEKNIVSVWQLDCIVTRFCFNSYNSFSPNMPVGQFIGPKPFSNTFKSFSFSKWHSKVMMLIQILKLFSPSDFKISC